MFVMGIYLAYVYMFVMGIYLAYVYMFVMGIYLAYVSTIYDLNWEILRQCDIIYIFHLYYALLPIMCVYLQREMV